LTANTNIAELASEMIGRDFTTLKAEHSAHVLALAGAQEVKLAEEHGQLDPSAPTLLQVIGLHVEDDILGVAGVDGNGQRELVEAIARLRPINAGKLFIEGEDAAAWSPRDFVAHKTAYITEDRQNEGLILNFDISRNATLKLFERPPFANRGLINRNKIIGFTRKLLQAFDVRAASPFVRAGTLSGGNQQKLVLARELSQKPHLIIANKPTRGLDIGAAAYIHQKLLDERARGAGLLLISSDLDEIFLLSDRILVMFNGQAMGIVETHNADIRMLGRMMAGTPFSALQTQEAAR
jgi:simple sugar transport system ATP-binding protein